jgi:ketosteroid isomerase-like protein
MNGITSIRTSTTAAASDSQAIHALLHSLRQAHHDKDAAAIAACYAPEAPIFDLSPPLAHPGVDPEQKQTWLDGWEGPIELETPPGTLLISGDLAIHHGFTRMTGRPKAAGRLVSFWLRDTIVLSRLAEGWRIVHLHSSVPFHMDGSLRPAFDLQP